MKKAAYPTTPDGRYFVVRGRLWRCSNPNLPEGDRAREIAWSHQPPNPMSHTQGNCHCAVLLAKRT